MMLMVLTLAAFAEPDCIQLDDSSVGNLVGQLQTQITEQCLMENGNQVQRFFSSDLAVSQLSEATVIDFKTIVVHPHSPAGVELGHSEELWFRRLSVPQKTIFQAHAPPSMLSKLQQIRGDESMGMGVWAGIGGLLLGVVGVIWGWRERKAVLSRPVQTEVAPIEKTLEVEAIGMLSAFAKMRSGDNESAKRWMARFREQSQISVPNLNTNQSKNRLSGDQFFDSVLSPIWTGLQERIEKNTIMSQPPVEEKPNEIAGDIGSSEVEAPIEAPATEAQKSSTPPTAELSTPAVRLQEALLNLEVEFTLMQIEALEAPFKHWVELWSIGIDRLDQTTVDLKDWAEEHWLPMLSQLAQYYSQACRLEFESHAPITEARKAIESFLFDKTGQVSIAQGWFEIEVLYPYESKVNYDSVDYEIMGSRTVPAAYVGCIIELLRVGCRDISGRAEQRFQQKARVLVGGR